MRKKRLIIFGAGTVGKKIIYEVEKNYEIICFIDNDKAIQGDQISSLFVYPVDYIKEVKYDYILIATLSPEMYQYMNQQLIELGVVGSQIIYQYYPSEANARNIFVRDIAKVFNERGIEGAIAEVGVFQGEFAKILNTYFPERKLYLFDTFEGFVQTDINIECEMSLSDAKPYRFNETSSELVLKKMIEPSNCIIKKGYFPDTTEGINESFCFVNLDVDLYLPTYNGLEWFSIRMVPGGVIIIHDYFSTEYRGIRKAVSDFLSKYKKKGYTLSVIGDGISVALYGF